MTLNQIFRIIENFAISHSGIKTIVFGAKWNIDNGDSDGILLWYDVQSGTIDGTQLNYTFELYFLDVLNSDDSNLKDVLSDTLQAAQDMAAMLYNYDDEVEFDVPKRATVQPVQHKFTSDYAGHSLTITIESPLEWNSCWIPENIPAVPIYRDIISMIIIENVTSSAQSDDLIGVALTDLVIFGAGTEQITINNVSSYDSATGTINFVNDLGGMTIRIVVATAA